MELAADRMAKELLGIATDTNVPEGVRLAAVKDALDRAGLAAKTAVEVEVSTKPFELVFERISSGPRDPQAQPALEQASEDDDSVVIAEIDEDPLPEDDDEIEEIDVETDFGYTDAEIIDVDPVPLTPEDQDQAVSEPHSLIIGSPPSGLMTLEQAVEQAALMRSRANIRSARRR